MAYDRYKSFVTSGQWLRIPFVEIGEQSTDKFTYYQAGKTRMDLLSYQYYGDANYGWLIMQANPQYGSMEFSIPHNARLRIPYPLGGALESYEEGIQRYNKLYGLTN